MLYGWIYCTTHVTPKCPETNASFQIHTDRSGIGLLILNCHQHFCSLLKKARLAHVGILTAQLACTVLLYNIF